MAGEKRSRPDLSPEERRARVARALAKRGAPAEEAGIPRRGPGAPPLSFAQERMWVVDLMQPGQVAYNLPFRCRLRGPLDVAILGRCLDALVARHEALRTTFRREADGAVQRIAPPAPLALDTVDLSADPARESRGQELAYARAREPFDLAAGPLVRARLAKLADDDHLLLLEIHHTVGDGWSLGILHRELAQLYEAFAAGQPSPLAEPAVQYADFAVWQRARLAGPALARQRDYWKEQLAGAATVLDLPADKPRPGLQSLDGACEAVDVPAELVAALRETARGADATPFMTLAAAWCALLHRYTGKEDLCVGVPVAGRGHPDLEGTVGLFVNTVVVRARPRAERPFRELLGEVRATVLDGHAHQDYPFEQIVNDLGVERDLTRNPIFQVGFGMMSYVTGEQQGGPVAFAPVAPDFPGSQFDLMLYMTEGPDTLRLTFNYCTDLFEAATIRRMAGHYLELLRGVVADPATPLGDLPLLTAAERAQQDAWNETARDAYPLDRCLHELFEAQVERTPDAVAVVFEDEKLSYRELNHRANRLAHHLRGLGVGPDRMVGVCAERSLELVVALYAVLKAGGAYVPMDPAYPAERLAFMLEDARVPVLLTQRRLVDNLPPHETKVVLLDDEPAGPDRNPPLLATPRDLAYMIYTSGSTGKPKGAMNEHRGIVNRLAWMQEEYGLAADDVVVQKTPFSFDVSVWEFFWPLLYGARLVVARPDGHRDSRYLIELIRSCGVTTIHFVPSMLQLFLEDEAASTCEPLRRVICSGEALPADLVARFHARLGAGLHNLYGPTEAAIDVTYWPCERGDERRSVPIGRPVANTQVHVLDPRGNRLPVGVPGELHLGGVQVGRGYWNRPELTAERFVPDPFSDDPEARLYRTGDLCRFLADGVVEYLGRNDHQVKIRGFRIELGEIESVLRDHPDVREAVVMAREDTPGDKRLAAYVVSSLDEAALPAALREHLLARLADYMVPAAFVRLDALPLLPNGKVDRKALPAPETGRRPDAAYVAPRNETEQAVAAAWRDVLGLDQVGVDDNFFDLGGHSLLLARVHRRLEKELARTIPLVELFRFPTIATLAGFLAEEAPDAGASLAEAADRGRRARAQGRGGRLGAARRRPR